VAGLPETLDREACAALDADDPLAPLRARFRLAEGLIYLDGNSLGALPAATPPRLGAVVEGEWGRGLIRSWNEAGWIDAPVRLGDKVAPLVGAGPGEVLVADSTSVNLFKLLGAAVRARRGRRVILCHAVNFPADLYIAQGLCELLDGDCELRTVAAAELGAALDGDVAVLMATHVDYATGAVQDMAGLCAAARGCGALSLWDLSHSAAALPVDLGGCGADLAVGCGYKYLNGGPGAPAFAYVAERLQDELRQPVQGWMGAAEPFAMAADYQAAKGIRGFISGTPPVLAMQPLKDMLELIAEAGLPAVRRKSVALTGHAIALSVELLAPLGAVLASPRSAAERGSHVTVDHPAFAAVTAALWERGVLPDFRPPAGIRIGLSPLSTSFAELEYGVEAIAAELRPRA
jgi:kynureninase